MTKITVLTHPSNTKTAEITRVLVALGVKEVKPFYSNFGKLSISQRMSPTLSSVGNGADKSNMVEQKKTVSALKKLILNLFVENQDVPAWGWVEPKAIHLMDFLLDIDPSSMLLFVIHKPEEVLLEFLQECLNASEFEIEALLEDWYLYNNTLLNFYLKNPHRVVVVCESDLASKHQILYERMCLRSEVATIKMPTCDEVGSDTLMPKTVNFEKESLHFFACKYLELNGKYSSLYQEFKFISCREDVEYINKNIPKSFYLKQICSLLKISKEKNRLTQMIISNESKYLEMLHRVQEQYEQFYKTKVLESPNGDSKTSDISSNPLEHQIVESLTSADLVYGAADRVKNQLSYRVGTAVVTNSKTFTGLLKIPVSIWRAHRDYKSYAKETHGKLPKIFEYADYAEAEKVKKHLSYRIGLVLVSHAKKPTKWLNLPIALYQEISSFRHQNK